MSEAELLRCRALMGKPPVLSSENPAHFEELFRLTAAAAKPRNMIDVMNVWYSVCASWSINRCYRHATVAIERHTLQMQANEAERARLRQLRASNQEHIEARKLTGSPADIADTVRLHENFEDRIGDADRIFEHSDLERDHNRSLLAMLDSQEKLNRLIISQTAIKKRIVPTDRTLSDWARPTGRRGHSERYRGRVQGDPQARLARRRRPRSFQQKMKASMTSNRKIAANRRNSRKSCGPRTAAGKSDASRSALRDGLVEVITHRQPLPSIEIEEFARALCGDDADPATFAQAVKVAENEMTAPHHPRTASGRYRAADETLTLCPL